MQARIQFRTRFGFVRVFFDTLLISAFAVGSLLTTIRVGLAPRDPANGVAVVFSPWTGAEAALARATESGSRFVRFGAYPFIVVVVPEQPDYVSRVSRGGALLVLDPEALAACSSSSFLRTGNDA